MGAAVGHREVQLSAFRVRRRLGGAGEGHGDESRVGEHVMEGEEGEEGDWDEADDEDMLYGCVLEDIECPFSEHARVGRAVTQRARAGRCLSLCFSLRSTL